MTDLAFAAITAPLDDRLSPVERLVMATIARYYTDEDLTGTPRPDDVTLDALCHRSRLPWPYVFAAVARLEDLGYLPTGAIR